MKNTKIIRKKLDRGFFNHGWLKSYHTFSFADYFDRNFMGFHSLRVINEDFIKAKNGFGFHPHSDMEIVTFVIRGTLTHEDNLGNREEIGAGCFQIMSAGTGIVHGEFNYSDEEVHLLQIWIKPNATGGAPFYRIFNPDIKEKWSAIATADGNKNSLTIKQDASVYAIDSGKLSQINLPNLPQKNFWLQLATGNITLDDGTKLEAGDAIGFSDVDKISKINFNERSQIIFFGL